MTLFLVPPSEPGGQRRVYGRSDRPSVDVPLAGEWVTGEVLSRIRDVDGTWWARVGYLEPEEYEYVIEALPEDVLRSRG